MDILTIITHYQVILSLSKSVIKIDALNNNKLLIYENRPDTNSYMRFKKYY